MIDLHLLQMLACPKCKGAVKVVNIDDGIVCDRCKLQYPIWNDIPVMIIQEAKAVGAHTDRAVKRTSRSKGKRNGFRMIKGPDAGRTFSVEARTCAAIGRGDDQLDRTTVLDVEVNLSLDDNMKSFVQAYIARQFEREIGLREGRAERDRPGEDFGGFQRAPDVLLSDPSLSRVHAMVFADADGHVGILDLVSKNGTYVGGEEIESRLLVIGDVIDMGETRFVFEG